MHIDDYIIFLSGNRKIKYENIHVNLWGHNRGTIFHILHVLNVKYLVPVISSHNFLARNSEYETKKEIICKIFETFFL